MRSRFSLSLPAICALAATAQAAINQTNDISHGTQAAYTASSTDLINDGQPSLLSESFSDFTVGFAPGIGPGDPSVLNNGLIGGVDDYTQVAFEESQTGYQVDYILDTSTNIFGYEITEIQTIIAWSHPSRVGQRITVLYSVVGDASYTSLGEFTLPRPTETGSYSTRMTLTDSSGTIATNVDALRFMLGGLAGLGQMYREIDVFGAAVPVPEPAAAGLLAIGLIGLRRRRRG
jgi:hypothetical protein